MTLAAVGTDIGEANKSKEKEVVKAAGPVTEADKMIAVGQDGVARASFASRAPSRQGIDHQGLHAHPVK